jgi:hypothetical protein
MAFRTKPDFEWTPGAVIPSTQVTPAAFINGFLTSAEMRYGHSELKVACMVWASSYHGR